MAREKTPESELPRKRLRDKYLRLHELVVEQLTNWIMDGTLKAGQRIIPEEICNTFGVSRMPVRDALKVLEESGLVIVKPYLGTTVVSLTLEDIRELYILRIALEPVAAFHAVSSITDEEIESLVEIQSELEEIYKKDASERDKMQIYDANRRFHMALYSCSRMKRLCKTIDGIWNNLAYARLKSVYETDKYLNAMEKEHSAYLDCINKRDAQGVSDLILKALRDHYDRLYEIYHDKHEPNQEENDASFQIANKRSE
jgi:DNA-binding GntR family transcriptional regulator